MKTGIIVSLLTMAMLLSFLPPAARAFIPEPYELYGVARDSAGVVFPDGTPIRSFIDGVDYSNKTSVFSRPGFNDGYFDIDTYGNYTTNGSDPGTPEIKEGGYGGEPIMYTWGDMTGVTNTGVFEETHSWETGLPPQAGNLNAAPPAEQPPLIKIYSIVTNSTEGTGTDYVWLCNPTSSAVDASQFYIQKDVPGDFYGPTVPATGTISAGGSLFVDLMTDSYFVESGDNVKLVWTNTGTAFGGNDIIVDRVEFNASTGGSLYWEPGNTIQNDEMFPVPPAHMQINRTAACGDTNSASRDFFFDVEIRQNQPPDAPDPICLQGICSDAIIPKLYHITTVSNFPINWTHHDPDGNPQARADVQILSQLVPVKIAVWQTVVPGATAITTFPLTLNTCTDYWLEVRTWDAITFGPWATLMFHTNCPPTSLNNRAPSNGAILNPNSGQLVWWSQAIDNDPGDLINYTYQVATDFAFSNIVASGPTTNNYSAPFATVCGSQYFWHVNASDGWVWIPFTSPYQFTTTQCGVKPTATALTLDGHLAGDPYLNHVVAATPTFGWTFVPGTVGRTQTAYHIQVVNTTTTTVVWDLNTTGTTSSVPYGGGWPLTDGTNYSFCVKVADSGVPVLWSDWSSPCLDFTMNSPPPIPALSAPPDDSTVAPSTTQTVAWGTVTDAEGDTVTYDYCVATTDPPYTGCGIAKPVSPISGTTSGAFTTTDGTNYYWAVRAYDGQEYSGWSAVWNFTAVVGNNAPSITLGTTPATLTIGTQHNITWTMNDVETAQANLIVYLNYTCASTTTAIAGPLVGQTWRLWAVPSPALTGCTFDAIVIDEGGLNGTDTSTSFNIVKPTPPPQPTDLMPIIIGVIIIIVVIALLLLFLLKRKKPKEEEEGAPAAEEEAPAEEEVAEEELVEEEEAPAPAPKAAPPAAVKPAAKPSGKTKECPSCGTIVSATDKECFMCGAKL